MSSSITTTNCLSPTQLSSSNHTKSKKSNDSELKQEETPEKITSPPLQDLTIETKEENTENTENIDHDESSDDESESSSDDDDDSDNEMFTGLSKESINKMKQRMGMMQNGYNNHLEKEKARQIKDTQHSIEFNLGITVNDEEAEFIIEFVEENNYNLQEQLQDEGLPFLQSMKEMMEQSKLIPDNNHNTNNNNDYEWPDTNSDEDEDWVVNEKKKKAARAAKRKNKNVGKMRNLDGSVRCGRLLLNDALKNTSSMEGWSEARQKAWKNRRKSPNAYFYRFNVPGQPQKNGKWTVAEHALFMNRVIEFGVNDQWGIFSKTIPGRVGYQCSNYWRGLVKEGDVSDPNYHYDGKKLHFKRHTKTFSIKSEYRKYAITVNRDISKVWKDLPRKHDKHPSEEYCKLVSEALSGAVNAMNEKNKNKKKRKKMDEDEDWDGKPVKRRRRNNNRNHNYDEAFHCSVNMNGVESVEDDNPIPDFIDIMTGTVVVKPAISPYGHVLGYDTWTKILRTSKHKNLCPFTLQKMTRRSLVKLTKENYGDYKGKITNITKEQTDLLTSING